MDDLKACVRLNAEMRKNLATAAKELSKVSNSMWAINTVKNCTKKPEGPLETGPRYYGPSFCGSARDRTRKAFMAQSKAFQEIYDSARESINQLGESKRDKGYESMPKDVETSMADDDGVPEEEEIIPDDEDEPVIESAEKTSAEKTSDERTSNEITKAATIFVEDMKNEHPLTMLWPNSKKSDRASLTTREASPGFGQIRGNSFGHVFGSEIQIPVSREPNQL